MLSEETKLTDITTLKFNLSLDRPPSSQWRRRPGRPRSRWVNQLRTDTNSFHLQTSGGVLSTVVTAGRRYGPCRLSDNKR